MAKSIEVLKMEMRLVQVREELRRIGKEEFDMDPFEDELFALWFSGLESVSLVMSMDPEKLRSSEVKGLMLLGILNVKGTISEIEGNREEEGEE